jgi:hypothetical protein
VIDPIEWRLPVGLYNQRLAALAKELDKDK